MRSALLLAEGGDVFGAVRAVLVAQGAVPSADREYVQVDSPDGQALLYELPGDDWRIQRPTAAGGTPVPDMATMQAVMIESRQPGLVVKLVRELSERLPFDLWLLDSADNVLHPDQLDPRHITL
jgi:hypothetical protein